MHQAQIRRFLNSRIGILIGILAVSGLPLFVPYLYPEDTQGYAEEAATLLLIALFMYLRGVGLRELGLNRPESWLKTFMLALLYSAVGFVLFRMLLEPSLEIMTGRHRDLSAFDFLRGNPGALLGLLPAIWITVPFFEEVYYRGFLVTQISQLIRPPRWNWVCAILLAAAVFGYDHSYQGLNGVLFTGISGIWLGAIFVAHRRNLWLTMLVHTAHDTISMLLIYSGTYAKVTHLLF
jgi:uncharacterized protein